MATKVSTSLIDPPVYSQTQTNAAIAAAIAAAGGGTTANIRRIATVVIAASDSVDKANADFVCTGTADQVTIKAAIDSVRGKPSLIFFRGGLYSLTAPVVVDTSWVTLEGEMVPKWKAYTGPGSGTGYRTFPRSAPGTAGQAGGALFIQNTAGQGAFRVGTTYFSGESRHKDIVFSRLGMYGPSGTGIAILDSQPSDFCQILECFIHGFQGAIDVSWDNPVIWKNNIQDTGGNTGFDCVRTRGYRGQITDNCIFQVGGNGIRVGSVGTIVANNIVGATNEGAILVTCGRVKVLGNHIMAWSLSNVSSGSGGIVVGNFQAGNLMDLDARGVVISGNTIQKTGDYEDDPVSDVGIGGGNCITLGAGSDGSPQGGAHSNTDYIVVSGNHCLTNQLTPGRAIQLDGNSNYCSVTGNTVMGPFNNNATGAINLGGGTGNKSRGNTGPLVGADAG